MEKSQVSIDKKQEKSYNYQQENSESGRKLEKTEQHSPSDKLK